MFCIIVKAIFFYLKMEKLWLKQPLRQILKKCWFFTYYKVKIWEKNRLEIDFSWWVKKTALVITHDQGRDLYAFLGFIGFIGPDDINYMCWTFSDNMCYILVIKY